MPPEEPQRPVQETPGPPSWLAPVKPAVLDHELLKRIGGGSYGDVWLARSVVGTWRAVKVVFRDRFLDSRPYDREFKGIQKFEPLSRSNEGFIDILQIGRNDAAGYFYYVMELADDAAPEAKSDQTSVIGNQSVGSKARQPLNTDHCSLNTVLDPSTYVPKTLAKALLQRGRLPVGECLELGITLNLALARLHTAGLIHRDIKPSNIIFVGGVPKLADIGLVIEVAEARSYVGTEGFIPPEGPNSPQADLYSLGKVLYEAGMGKDRKDFPEPPTQIAQVPDSAELLEFNAVLLKACAANVKDRYESAEEMNADLALLQSGGSVRRQRTLTRRLRSVQRAGALVTALAVVIGAGWLWQARETHIVRNLAAEKTRLAEEKATIAEVNRERLVRVGVANGIRLMDAEDPAGALLWFTGALPLVTNRPAEETVHRIRIQQLLERTPRVLSLMAEEASISSSAFSPDGALVATGTVEGRVRVWNAASGSILWERSALGGTVAQARFTRDGKALLLCSTGLQGNAGLGWSPRNYVVSVLDAGTGKDIFRAQAAIPGLVSNLVSCTFSPDDRWVGVALTDNVIRVLDARDGRGVVELKGHTDEIRMLVFNSDGTLLASASKDKTARVWRIPAGDLVGEPIVHQEPLRRVVFSPNSRLLATATDTPAPSQKCVVQTWEIQTGRRVGAPINEDKVVVVLDFDPGTGKYLITGGEKHELHIWYSETHQRLYSLLTQNNQPGCWEFSPDGRYLAVGTEGGITGVWDVAGEGSLGFPLFRHTGWVESVHFSPDGSRLLTTSDDGTAKLWDLTAPSGPQRDLQLRPPRQMSGPSPDGRYILASSRDFGPARIDLTTLRKEPLGVPATARLRNWSWDSTGRQWAATYDFEQASNAPGLTVLWRQEGDVVKHFQLSHPKTVWDMAFTAGGDRLITVADDVKARVWATAGGTLLRELPLPINAGYLFGFSPDGQIMALGLARPGRAICDIRLYDIESGSTIGAPLHEANGFGAAAFSPDNHRLATVGGQTGRIWDARTGQPITPPFKHGGALVYVEWSPDGRTVVTAGLSPEAKIWDATTGALVLAMLATGGGGGAPSFARFIPNGRLVVTHGGARRTVRVWDATTAEAVTPLQQFEPADGDVEYANPTASGQLLITTDHGTLRMWDLLPNKLEGALLADLAVMLAGQRLSPAGVIQPVLPNDLQAIYQRLRDTIPDFFLVPDARLREWHQREQAPRTSLFNDQRVQYIVSTRAHQHERAQPNSLSRLEAAIFHAEWLAKLDPHDAEIGRKMEQLKLFRTPPRDPAARQELIDLSNYYSHSLELMDSRGAFQELPRGVQRLAGTEFDIRGVVWLGQGEDKDDAARGRTSSRQILIDRRCSKLHFLLASEGLGYEDGMETGHIIFHYANGSQRRQPLIHGRQLRDYWCERGAPREASDAVLAWEGNCAAARERGATIRLFKFTWTNPEPDAELSQVDLEAGEVNPRPFVVAITAE